MSLYVQFYLLIHMILYGAFLGITYDCATTIKNDLRNKYMKIALMIFYWLLQIPLIYVFIYNINDGIFHLYIIPFILVGMLSYFKWMRLNFYGNLEIFGKNIYKILKFLKKLLFILVISPIVFIYKFISDIMKGILKIFKFIFYTPFIKLGKWGSNKKKVKRRVKKANGNQTE